MNIRSALCQCNRSLRKYHVVGCHLDTETNEDNHHRVLTEGLGTPLTPVLALKTGTGDGPEVLPPSHGSTVAPFGHFGGTMARRHRTPETPNKGPSINYVIIKPPDPAPLPPNDDVINGRHCHFFKYHFDFPQIFPAAFGWYFF